MSSRSFDLLAQKMVKQRQPSTDKLRVENRELHQRLADLRTDEDRLADLRTGEEMFLEVSGKRFALNVSPMPPASAQPRTLQSLSPVQKVNSVIADALTKPTAGAASSETVEAQLCTENQTLREQVKKNQVLQEEWLKTQEQLRLALARIAELEKKKKKTGTLSTLGRIVLVLAGLTIFSVLIWQGITSSGNPDPTLPHLSQSAVILDSGILVFRQGLEAILVLAAMTASFVGAQHSYRRPIAIGAGLALLATVATWFVAIGIIGVVKAPVQDVEAVTGLLAIILLLIIMNWFFHKIYWTGWISFHNRRRRNLVKQKGNEQSRTMFGLALLGFTAVYREGFEIVLFLQNLRIQAGSLVVLEGIGIGLILTAIVGTLTFVLHQKLPYKKMLVFTGVLLGVFLTVVVGQTAQNLQEAHWISTTTLHLSIPDWMGVWFAVFPTVESLCAQLFAAVFVIGSYFMAQYLKVWRPRRQAKTSAHGSESAPVLQPSHATGSSTH